MKNTKYLLVADAVRQKIEGGDYPKNTRIPSKRVLADQYGVSLITSERALSLLSEEGYLTARERRGFFVSEDLPPRRTVQPPLSPLPEPKKGEVTHSFESSVWFRTVRRVIADRGDLLFEKAPPFGCPTLRNAVASYLSRYRGISVDPRRILIGSGSEQLYESVVKLLGRDRLYGIEDPSYRAIRSAYLGMGASVRPLALGEDGIRSELLTDPTLDILHVTPFHSFPSGVTTPKEKRREYLAWLAERETRYLIEDDYDSEFFRPGHPVATLFETDTSGRVLYLNTFSKSLSPAMRIGYLILPPPLLPRAEELFRGASCPVPVMDQYILAEFLNSGDFERHLNRARRRLCETES